MSTWGLKPHREGSADVTDIHSCNLCFIMYDVPALRVCQRKLRA